MPLMIMSPNIQELDSPSRKRNHEEYSESGVLVKSEIVEANDPLGLLSKQLDKGTEQEIKMESSEMGTSLRPPYHTVLAQSPPAQSSPAALTEAGSSQPTGDSTAPTTPTRQPLQSAVQPTQDALTSSQPATSVLPMGQAPPAKKRRKLTPAEKKAKEEEEAARKQEIEKRKKEAELAKILKEEQKELKRVEIEKNKLAKEEKKKESERKTREKQEEAERKARAQPKIANFFVKKREPAAVSKPESEVKDCAVKARIPSPPAAKSEYEKLAPPFFIHQNVTLAKSLFATDEETQNIKTSIFEEYLSGGRSPVSTKPFNPRATLHLPTPPVPRGKKYPSVRELMSEHYGLMSNPIDLTSGSQSLQVKNAQQTLKGIPVKQISFHEDVRPGYYGTVTSVQSLQNLKKLARNPTAKDLPLNYDYDSEAEWVQGDEEPGDDEDGEDLSDEDDDEEEDDKSIDEFLDDSEDVARVRGPFAMSTLEPEISGICFEDHKRQNPNPQLHTFRMEFLLPNLEHHHSIDPFSTAYWPSDPSPTTQASSNKAVKNKTAKPLTANNGGMAPPPVPNETGAATSTKPISAADLVPASQLDDFKATIVEFKFLPKAALLPTLKKKFGDRCTSGQIKATLEHVAEKPSKKGDWQLKAGT